MKRFLSGLLALVLTLGMLPAQAATRVANEEAPSAAMTEVMEEPVPETDDHPELPETPPEEEETEPPAELAATGEWLTVPGIEGGQIRFDSSTGEITDCDTTVTVANIPSTIGGVGVTSIGSYAFWHCASLTAVTIPDGVTNIEDCAFSSCTSLASVTILNGVTSIGEDAFNFCTDLNEINVAPENTAYSSEKGVLFNKKKTTLIQCPAKKSGAYTIPSSVTKIEYEAFEDCASLTSVTIPDSVTSVGDCAFYGCTSLTDVYITDVVAWCEIDFDGANSNPLCYADNIYLNGELVSGVVIPDGVTTIPQYAFSCANLTSVTIPDSVTSIEYGAFSGCTGLTSVIIPDGVTHIEGGVFCNCTNLTSVVISDSVTGIGGRAFDGCTSLTSVTIPNGVATIWDYTFSGCTSLTAVTIPDSVTNIMCGAFDGCTSLTSVTIPDSVTNIEYGAFEDCTSLTSVTIPKSVTRIENSAFSGCTSLASMTIPEGVTSIGISAFSGCTSLASVTIPEGVTSIKYEAFYGCTNLISITVPESVTSIEGKAFSNCSALRKILVSSDNSRYCTIDGVLFDIATTVLLQYPSGKLDSAYAIPEGVTQISSESFRGNAYVEDIEIPSSVSAIGPSVFRDCTNLRSVIIPDGVTDIGVCAFCGCTSLSNVTIPNSVNTIGDDAFRGCTNLAHVVIGCAKVKNYGGVFEYCSTVIIEEGATSIEAMAFYACTNLTNVTIPRSVTSIGREAFECCDNLTCIQIPDGVTHIDDGAFEHCENLTSLVLPASLTNVGDFLYYDTPLETVLYSGTKEQWEAIEGPGLPDPYSEVKVFYNVPDVRVAGVATTGTSISFDSAHYIGTTGTELMLWTKLTAGQQNCQTLADSLTWTSSDENVFPLDADGASALVYGPTTGEAFRSATPRAAGVSTVTVTTADGASASCVVAVSEGKLAVSVPGDTYTVREGNSGVAYVDVSTPNGAGLNWTWTSSNSSIVSFEQYKAVGSVDVLEPDLSGRDPYHFSGSIKFYGRAPGTATLTCTSKDGQASASRTVVVVGADSQERTIESNHYNVPKLETPQEADAKEQLSLYYADWYEAYEGYIDALRSALEKAQKKDEEAEPSLEEQARALMEADKKAKNKYLTFTAGFPAEWKLYAYQELCDILETAAEKKLDLSSVNLKDEFTVGSSVVNQIANSISMVQKDTSYGNVKVTINCGNYFGASLGSMTFTSSNQKYARTHTVIVCPRVSDIKKMVADYLNQLRDLEVKAANNIYSAIATDILGQSLGSLTEKYLSRKIAKFQPTLEKLHLGTPFKVLVTCHDYSKKYYNLYKTLKKLDPSGVDTLRAELLSLDTSDETVTDRAAKNAVSILKKAQGKLNDALLEYATTEKVSPPKKGWLDCILSVIMCPVNVSVYRGETQVGYVGEDDIWYDEDEILIEETGGAKKIYSKPGDALTFRVEGENYGLMSCTVEEYSDGAPIGRLNFYDIPLSDQASFSATLPTGAVSENQDELTLTSGTETIAADEYIPVSVNACVSVSATASDEERGTVLGTGKCVRGDAVVLRAIPADGSVFLGWFDQQNDLVAVEGVYEFTAREDMVLTARFAENQAPLDRIFATVSEEDPGTAELFDPGGIMEEKPLVLAARYQDGQLTDVAAGTVAENGAAVSFPGRSLGKGWMLFFLGDEQRPACQKIELH